MKHVYVRLRLSEEPVFRSLLFLLDSGSGYVGEARLDSRFGLKTADVQIQTQAWST